MPNNPFVPISCDCVPPERAFTYGSSQPQQEIGDLRTSIGYREYYQDQTIDELVLPKCLSIGEEAFRESSIEEIYIPKCSVIKEGTFQSSGIRTGDFSSVEKVEDYAFFGCSSLAKYENVDFSSVKEVGAYAFSEAGYDNGFSIDITRVETLGTKAFYGSYAYQNIGSVLNLPNCKTIGSQALAFYASDNAPHFSHIYLPSVTSIDYMAFRGMNPKDGHFEMHIGPNCTYIGDNILFFGGVNSASVRDFYIEAVVPPTLVSPFETSVGEIYWWPTNIFVPAQSLAAYQTADQWKRYAVRQGQPTDIFKPLPT